MNCLHLYDYILQHYISNNSGLKILDAGCGVGFGSIFLAEKTQNKIVGISLSDLEINRANSSLKEKGFTNCSFQKLSFDKISHEKYDLILCVESFKHSGNFQSTLNHFKTILNPGGKVIVVDDFYSGETPESKLCSRYKRFWSLNQLLSEKDLFEENIKRNQKDFTQLLKTNSKISIVLKFYIVLLLSVIKGEGYRHLFGGGIILENLYLKKQMKYKLIEMNLC
jgi:2-polyprenyl-3-methyl-5-hydroxy-6-metoxy-1,4-benzoquinol methylase